MTAVDPEPGQTSPLRAALSLFDATSIIVAIVIGSTIYEKAPAIAAMTTGWVVERQQALAGDSAAEWSNDRLKLLALAAVIGVWLVGGLIALVGALCYAELATAYPHAGGTYIYLSRAFGRHVGFAFVWAEFWIVRPGNVGAIAFVFATYAGRLFPALERVPQHEVLLAGGSILALALINAIGLVAGKWTQNALMACKVVGLIAIFAAGMLYAAPAAVREAPLSTEPNLPLAMIFVMFAYGGWADMSYVAAEVRDPTRNISRALALGTLVIATIYVVVNLAFARSLGIGGMAESKAVAADVLALALGDYGSRAISLLICISCLGAVQGMIFTGARVYYALGRELPLFGWLGQWDEAKGVPARSLWLQTLVTVAMVAAFGLYTGDKTGFDRLVVFSAPFFWGFISLVGVALIVLRLREGTSGRLYRVPLYPLTPIVLSLSSAAMVYTSIDYAVNNPTWEAVWAGAVIASGAVLLPLVGRRRGNQPAKA
jgi:amino acid transporter